MRTFRYCAQLAAVAVGLIALLEAQQPAPLSPEQFFRVAGAGLRSIEQEQSDYWEPHVINSYRRILQAASLCERRSTVLVLGAGSCAEVPLEELAQTFDEVILVDLDEDSMTAAVEDLPEELMDKVRVRVDDVTRFAGPLMQRLWQSAVASETAEQLLGQFAGALDDLESRDSPFQLPEADLVVSSLVLSELHRYPLNYATRLARDKFGTRLTEWDGYAQFRERLQQAALEDHIDILQKSCRRGGAIYFADTITRGPVYEQIPPDQRHQVLLAMTPELARLGFFEQLQEEGELRDTFSTAFSKIRALWDKTEPASPEKTSAVIKQLSAEPQSLAEADRGAAAEAVVNLLCHERFEVDAETAALERVVGLYLDQPASFEPLVPLEPLQREWKARGLNTKGEAESWLWLEYPCSIAYSSGAFQIRSWLLGKAE